MHPSSYGAILIELCCCYSTQQSHILFLCSGEIQNRIYIRIFLHCSKILFSENLFFRTCWFSVLSKNKFQNLFFYFQIQLGHSRICSKQCDKTIAKIYYFDKLVPKCGKKIYIFVNIYWTKKVYRTNQNGNIRSL